ncbi:MAG: 16S rRNA (uracil(1498)-N(3))-methyltransferase [Candidatus Aminicenantes bacterium]|nr:16S rRNA (uracil(1498)-N(3))-methyltransferase [Candidatus Aminicenantes bacterium]
MTIHHFFLNSETISSAQVFLYGQEHHHLARVLRLKEGERIRLFNGKGEIFSGRIEKIERNKTLVRLEERLEPERINVFITVAQACLKSRVMDWVIAKMAELRVSKIIPLITQRTVVRFEEGDRKRIKRWQRLALEAAKQSQSSFIPEITSPQELEKVIRFCSEEKKYFLSEHEGELLKDILLIEFKDVSKPKPSSIIICVGPEGGWTKTEEELLVKNSFQPISLGQKIYRAETALLIVTSILTHFWNA